MIGSQPHRIVVMFRSFIWARIPVAWSDIVARSSAYFRLKPGVLPPLRITSWALATDSWYHEFSGASVAMFRGRSFSGLPSPPTPPAKAAGLSYRRLTAYSPAISDTIEPSVARL